MDKMLERDLLQVAATILLTAQQVESIQRTCPQLSPGMQSVKETLLRQRTMILSVASLGEEEQYGRHRSCPLTPGDAHMKKTQDRRGEVSKPLDRKEINDRVSQAEERVRDFLKNREDAKEAKGTHQHTKNES